MSAAAAYNWGGPYGEASQKNASGFSILPTLEQIEANRKAMREIEGAFHAGRSNSDTRHGHYFKDVSHLQTVDIYRVLDLFEVTDPCLQHAAKKLMVAGGRGAGKSIDKDVQEAIDSLVRWQSMRKEDAKKAAK